MSSPLTLWTSQLEWDFHTSVAELQKVTDIPAEARYYRGDEPSTSDKHILSFRDELQFADNLAFLCHWHEGGYYISAVTLRECHDHLIIQVASNLTPSPAIIEGLKDLMGMLAQYASQKRHREEFGEMLFDKVLQLSEQRILNRLRPPWVKQPSYMSKRLPFLGDQLLQCVRTLRQGFQTPQATVFINQTDQLIASLEVLRQQLHGSSLMHSIKTVIHKCVHVAALGKTRSVEQHLKSLGMSAKIFESPEIRQIDKIARYLFLCKDLVRIARREEYTTLLREINVIYLRAYTGLSRPAIKEVCHVHAEIQQVLHYETEPHHPAPRAIGCSKSACYLCDLFLHKQCQFRVSQSHRRLYHRWTLPDINLTTETQTLSYRAIIQSMVQDLRQVIRSLGGTKTWKPWPLESQAFLPLTSGSTVSEATIKIKRNRGSTEDDGSTPTKISQRTPLNQSFGDKLLFSQYMRAGQAPLDISIGMLSLTLESFSAKSNAQISISQSRETPTEDVGVVDVADIPIDSEMALKTLEGRSHLTFQLRYDLELCVDIKVRWIDDDASINDDI